MVRLDSKRSCWTSPKGHHNRWSLMAVVANQAVGFDKSTLTACRHRAPVRSSRIMVRCRSDHSLPLESAACSRDTVRLSARTRGPEGTGFAPIHRLRNGTALRASGERSCGASRAKPSFFAYCFTTCQTTRSVTPSPQQGNEAHTNPTRRISNETQHHVNHRVSALDPLADASHYGRHRAWDIEGRELKHCAAHPRGPPVWDARAPRTAIGARHHAARRIVRDSHARHPHEGGTLRRDRQIPRRLFLRLDTLGARRARGLHLHPLGARTVGSATGPAPVVLPGLRTVPQKHLFLDGRKMQGD